MAIIRTTCVVLGVLYDQSSVCMSGEYLSVADGAVCV